MNGKELKAFAAKCSDEATIEVRERSYGDYQDTFSIRSVLEIVTCNIPAVVEPP